MKVAKIGIRTNPTVITVPFKIYVDERMNAEFFCCEIAKQKNEMKYIKIKKNKTMAPHLQTAKVRMETGIKFHRIERYPIKYETAEFFPQISGFSSFILGAIN